MSDIYERAKQRAEAEAWKKAGCPGGAPWLGMACAMLLVSPIILFAVLIWH